MYVYTLITSSVTAAHGGPEPERARPKEGATPTRAGRFVIGRIEPHRSSGRWLLSVVPWGTPIRLNAQRDIEVQLSGQWVGLVTLPGWRERFAGNPHAATDLYMQTYRDLMHSVQVNRFGLADQRQMPAPWNGQFPKYWNLNDFGRVAIKYVVDTNHDRKLDGHEQLLSDFIHTTPGDEMETLLSSPRLKPISPLVLPESHGCIHMLPNVLQDWLARKILVVGATLEVHPYSETTIRPRFERPQGQVGTEIHFYPRPQAMVLYQVARKQLGQPLHPAQARHHA